MIEPPRIEETEPLIGMARDTGFFTTEEIDVIREMLDEFFHPGPKSDYLFIAYREAAGGPALGWACYGPVPMSEGNYDLYWIVVDANHQNKRIGRQLLAFVETDAARRGARALYLETSDTDLYTPTRVFYDRLGYERAAHLPEFYKPGDGKVIYRKWLNRDPERGRS